MQVTSSGWHVAETVAREDTLLCLVAGAFPSTGLVRGPSTSIA